MSGEREGWRAITFTGECRLQSTEFDIAASAGWYSAIAGLLAGFALLSILFPLDHETIRSSDNDDQAKSDAVVAYTCAFFALLILALTYAVLKTYGANRGVFSSAQQVIVRMTSLYGPAAVIAMQCSSALDLERLGTGGAPGAAGRRGCQCRLFGGCLDGTLSGYPSDEPGLVSIVRLAVESARPTSTPRAIATIVVVVVVSV